MRLRHAFLASTLALTACSGSQLSTRSHMAEFAGFKRDVDSLKSMIEDALRRAKAVDINGKLMINVEVTPAGTLRKHTGDERVYNIQIGSISFPFRLLISETGSISVTKSGDKYRIDFDSSVPVYALDEKGSTLLVGENMGWIEVEPPKHSTLLGFWRRPLVYLRGCVLNTISNETDPNKRYIFKLSTNPPLPAQPYVVKDQSEGWQSRVIGDCTFSFGDSRFYDYSQ